MRKCRKNWLSIPFGIYQNYDLYLANFFPSSLNPFWDLSNYMTFIKLVVMTLNPFWDLSQRHLDITECGMVFSQSLLGFIRQKVC